jgi:rubrerythrin
MTLGEALEKALAYEKKVRDHYLQAAERVGDEKGRKALRVLAREEQGHFDYLKSCLDRWSRTGRTGGKKLPRVFPPYADLESSLKRISELKLEKGSARHDSEELELLKTALQLERETADFYQKMAAGMDREAAEFFAPFLDIERGHQLIVQAEMDQLSGLGYWFDIREFDLEKA